MLYGGDYMEPQEYYLTKGCCSKMKCFIPILGILLIALFTVIGIIIGAEVAETILAAMAALITLAVTFGVLSIIAIIWVCCTCRKKEKKCC